MTQQVSTQTDELLEELLDKEVPCRRCSDEPGTNAIKCRGCSHHHGVYGEKCWQELQIRALGRIFFCSHCDICGIFADVIVVTSV